jgi:hypothetical protein
MRKKGTISNYIFPDLSEILVVRSQNFDKKKQKKDEGEKKMNRVMS